MCDDIDFETMYYAEKKLRLEVEQKNENLCDRLIDTQKKLEDTLLAVRLDAIKRSY